MANLITWMFVFVLLGGFGVQSVYPNSKIEDSPVIIKSVGIVLCNDCYGISSKSLEGAIVQVSCQVQGSGKPIVGYGESESNGNFSVKIEGLKYSEYGAAVCKAKLYAAPKGSSCSIITNLNDGKNGALLELKAKDQDMIVLQAKPFALASKLSCSHNFSTNIYPNSSTFPPSPVLPTPNLHKSSHPLPYHDSMYPSNISVEKQFYLSDTYSAPPPPAQTNSSKEIIERNCTKVGNVADCNISTTTTTYNKTQTNSHSVDNPHPSPLPPTPSGVHKTSPPYLFLTKFLFLVFIFGFFIMQY